MTNERIDKNAGLDSAFLFTNSGQQSLIIQLFDLGKLFVEKKMVSFSTLGTCMYPCIHPGDAIYILPKSVEEIHAGEVVVYRRYNRLFSHRAIAKGTDEKGAYVITRPDTGKYGDDGPVFDGDILGVVERIERRGRILMPAKRDYDLIEKIWSSFFRKYLYFKQLLLRGITFLVTFIQQFRHYRFIAELFSKNVSKEMTFAFSIPAHGKTNDKFYRNISEQDLVKLILNADDNSMPKWTITSKVKLRRQESAASLDAVPSETPHRTTSGGAGAWVNYKKTASLSFRLRPENCEFRGWWLIDAQVRIRDRGTIVEKALLDKVDGLLKQAGMSDIFAGVLRESHTDRMFLNGLGFKPIHSENDGLVAMRRRIV
jgi:hypothetical protein